MENVKYDLAVVGGGIVGLATLVQILHAQPHLRAVLVDKEAELARHQSGHNSGVIHSGIYYRPGSEKARLAVLGADMMKHFCRENDVPIQVSGKLIVATDQKELPALKNLYARGMSNGVPGIQRLSSSELRVLEPFATGLEAIHVPGAAIVDYHAVSVAMGKILQNLGVEILLGFEVKAIDQTGDAFILKSRQGALACRWLISCAGLQSDRLARFTGTNPGLRIVPFRGEYYRLSDHAGRYVQSMIYPVPDSRFPFLGVHFTRSVHGYVEAGPNAVLALSREGYRKFDFNIRDTFETLTYPGFLRLARKYWKTGLSEITRSYSRNLFTKSLQRLVPAINADDLFLGGSGVRAQAVEPSGTLVDDFHILETQRALFVCNAPSPAATASLAIGEQLADKFKHLMRQ